MIKLKVLFINNKKLLLNYFFNIIIYIVNQHRSYSNTFPINFFLKQKLKKMNDVLIICNNKKEIINLPNYSNNLIKSSYSFPFYELFKINNIIIEGLFITELKELNKDDKDKNIIEIYYIINKKREGIYLNYKEKSKKY
jgi:hypothetical protein